MINKINLVFKMTN